MRDVEKGDTTMARKVILDVDTGTDDAIAIMTAVLSPDLEVLGVCAVNGNRGIEFTTENTLRVMEYLGAEDIPVFRGCAEPMVLTLTPHRRPVHPYQGPEDPEDNVHGDYIELPPATIKPAERNAVSWLVDTLMASDGDITLIPVGPLTNIAMAMRIEPAIIPKIQEIVLMGGGCKEVNITPAAEFNFWIDPEAAAIVMKSGCKITMVPLDATHAAALSSKDQADLEALGTPAAKITAEIMQKRRSAYQNWQPMDDFDTVPVHDALAVCAVLDPTVLRDVRHVHVDVDFSGGVSDGQSLCDIGHRIKRAVPNAHVALGADREKFAAMLKEIFTPRG